jgi:hypothetical protein
MFQEINGQKAPGSLIWLDYVCVNQVDDQRANEGMKVILHGSSETELIPVSVALAIRSNTPLNAWNGMLGHCMLSSQFTGTHAFILAG